VIQGKGVATYPSGDVYVGMFVDGVRQGEGTLTYASGESIWHQTAMVAATARPQRAYFVSRVAAGIAGVKRRSSAQLL
jgi:hypothetical protein